MHKEFRLRPVIRRMWLKSCLEECFHVEYSEVLSNNDQYSQASGHQFTVSLTYGGHVLDCFPVVALFCSS